jgi:hypothetical protein
LLALSSPSAIFISWSNCVFVIGVEPTTATAFEGTEVELPPPHPASSSPAIRAGTTTRGRGSRRVFMSIQ